MRLWQRIQRPSPQTNYLLTDRPMRFTIRDLLWLMVVVGLGFGWWVDVTRPRTWVFDPHGLAENVPAGKFIKLQITRSGFRSLEIVDSDSQSPSMDDLQ